MSNKCDPTGKKGRLLSASIKIATIASSVRAVVVGARDQTLTIKIHIVPVAFSAVARPPDEVTGNNPARIRVDVDHLPFAPRALVEQLIVGLGALVCSVSEDDKPSNSESQTCTIPIHFGTSFVSTSPKETFFLSLRFGWLAPPRRMLLKEATFGVRGSEKARGESSTARNLVALGAMGATITTGMNQPPSKGWTLGITHGSPWDVE